MNLHVADNLSLPKEAITETFGILAVRGAGKSNTAAVMAEEMFKAKLPFVVIDPVRAWYGLRTSKDGRGPGLEIPIFGGRYGDVPLEKTGGVLVANLIVDKRLSCVLDISGFESEGAKKMFLLDFARQLYTKNEAPLHLFLEEADDYIPQRPMRDEAQLLRAWENIVRRGRGRGLGVTLITQRSASINKNVLEQVQTLIAMRTTGPRDRAAIEAWLKYHNQSAEILESLPGLKDGEAWVWSPEFLSKTVRVRFRMRDTYDSGATPKVGDYQRPRGFAVIDLDEIRKEMADTIERTKADDPRELKKKIAELEKQLKQKSQQAKTERIEIPIFPKTQIADIKRGLDKTEKALNQLRELGVLKGVEARLQEIKQTLEKACKGVPADVTAPVRRHYQIVARDLSGRKVKLPAEPSRMQVDRLIAHYVNNEPHPSVPRMSAVDGDNRLNRRAEREVLSVLAHHDGDTRSLRQIAIEAGYSMTGGGFVGAISKLKRLGYIFGIPDAMRITKAGIDAIGDTKPLPKGEALIKYWFTKLNRRAEREVLRVLVDAYPENLEPATIASLTNPPYEPTGGGFVGAVSKLKALGLITKENYGYCASQHLF